MSLTRRTWIRCVVLGCIVATSGCAMLSGTRTDSTGNQTLVQRVSPFVVLDSVGNAYDQPFLGGLNFPRPQFVDIDDDGDPDLFIQEMTGRISFHENIGSPEAHEYAWRTDFYDSLDVGDWTRFVDIDSDGDLDLLTERQYSRVRYYRNDGSAKAPVWTMAADTLKDVAGEPVFSDRQNNPNVADIDCDGLYDLFVGRLNGTVTRYELAEIDSDGIPRFEFVEDNFQGIEIVAQFGSMHGANGLAFFDVDADGDLDFFWGDFFEAGLLLIENTGTCEDPNLSGTPFRFPNQNPLETSGYNVPVFTDLDGDQDQDLFIGVLGGAFVPSRTASDNLYFLENDRGQFNVRTERFINGIDVGTESYPVLVDIDGDLDLDLFLANKIDPVDSRSSRMTFFRNVGSPTAPRFAEKGTVPLETYYHYAPTFADLDADGDLDMLLGTWNKGVAMYENTGDVSHPIFEERVSTFIKLTRGSNSTPTLGDVDGDGDMDLMIGEASGTINYYRNEGSAEAPKFELVSDEYMDIDVGRRSVPRLLDLDMDDDLDLLVSSESGHVSFFMNHGTKSEAIFVADTTRSLTLPVFGTPTFGDIDADGDWDIISGGSGGGVVFYESLSGDRPTSNTPGIIFYE